MALQSVTAIANITLQSASSAITFSGIPNIYRDLVLVFQGTTTPANGAGLIRFNGDATSGNYFNIIMAGNGGPAYTGYSANATGIDFALDFAVEAGFNNQTVVQVMDYSVTNKHKATIARSNIGDMQKPAVLAGRWASTAVVNSVTFTLNQNSYAAGSTFSLYGRIA